MAFTPKVTGSYGSFDSELSTAMVNEKTNAELTITIRLFLDKVDAKDTAGGTMNDFNNAPITILNWRDAEWEAFRKQMFKNIRNAWNGKLWLMTPTAYKDLDWPATPKAATHRPNVWCRLCVEEVNQIGKAHRKIVCVRPRVATMATANSVDAFRSFVGAGGEAGSTARVSTFDYFDIVPYRYNFTGPEKDGKGNTLKYGITHRSDIHEFGHLLGLDHSDLHTHTDAGTTHDEYGEDRADREDVMGYGSTIDASSAVPWLDRIAQHTGVAKASWAVKVAPYSWSYRPVKI